MKTGTGKAIIPIEEYNELRAIKDAYGRGLVYTIDQSYGHTRYRFVTEDAAEMEIVAHYENKIEGYRKQISELRMRKPDKKWWRIWK